MARYSPATSSRTSLSEDTAELMDYLLRHVSTRGRGSPRAKIPRHHRVRRSGAKWDDDRSPGRLKGRNPAGTQRALAQGAKRQHLAAAGAEAVKRVQSGAGRPPRLPRPAHFVSSSGSLLTRSVVASSEEDNSSSASGLVSWWPALCLALAALAATLAVVAIALVVSHVDVRFPLDASAEENDAMRVQDAPHVSSPDVVRPDASETAPPIASESILRLLPKVEPVESHNEAPATFGARSAAWSPKEEDDVFASGKRLFNASANSGGEIEGPHMCDGVFSTYCARAPTQFHYDRDTRTCVETALDIVQLCNQSPNRFASKADCNRSCVLGFAPEENCFDTPVFAQCGSQDVTATFWHFTGRTCTSWRFPRGMCPAHDARIFPSFDDCLEQCVRRPRAERPCEPLRPDDVRTCTVGELRHPYFADTAGDHVRCLAASVATFARHRCLVGTNRFGSKAGCERACLPRSSEGALGLRLN